MNTTVDISSYIAPSDARTTNKPLTRSSSTSHQRVIGTTNNVAATTTSARRPSTSQAPAIPTSSHRYRKPQENQRTNVVRNNPANASTAPPPVPKYPVRRSVSSANVTTRIKPTSTSSLRPPTSISRNTTPNAHQPVIWASSPRGTATSLEERLVREQKNTEKLLREQISQLRGAFETFRDHVHEKLQFMHEKLQSAEAKNAMLTNEVDDLKDELSSTTADRPAGAHMHSDPNAKTPSTDELLDELGVRLLETPMFAEKVADLIEHHQREAKLQNHNEPHSNSLSHAIPPLNENFITNTRRQSKQTIPRPPTKIRDESFIQQTFDYSGDCVEIIDDATSPLNTNSLIDNHKEECLSPSPQMSTHFDDQLNATKHRSANAENLMNVTYTISDSDWEECHDY